MERVVRAAVNLFHLLWAPILQKTVKPAGFSIHLLGKDFHKFAFKCDVADSKTKRLQEIWCYQSVRIQSTILPYCYRLCTLNL